MTTQTCLLCGMNLADKKNSHIIPRFLGKDLFVSVPARHTLAINRAGKGKKVQDIPKENNILCTDCEKRIELLETFVAPKFERLRRFREFPNDFLQKSSTGGVYLEWTDLHPTLFKLFIFSMMWRASISKLEAFRSFKLSDSAEEELRSFLDSSLDVGIQSLLNGVSGVNRVPSFDCCIIVPSEKPSATRVFVSSSMNETSHVMFLVNFTLFFYTSGESIPSSMKFYNNVGNDPIKIVLATTPQWNELNLLMVSRVVPTRSAKT